MKRKYESPTADLLRFDYREVVAAASSAGGDDASHCTFNANPGGCGPSNFGQCKEDYNFNPGRCKNNK